MSVNFKILYVNNLDTTVTSSDLKKLFDFNKTPFLRKHTCVEINEEGEERIAKVVSPEQVHIELLKLNGIEFSGKKLLIEAETESNDGINDIATGSTTNNNDDGSKNTIDTTVPNDILYMLLDCRNCPELNFTPVKEVEVCAALQLDHADDPHKAVKTFWGRNLGTFGIQSTDMSRYVDKHLVIRGHKIQLTPIRKRQPQQQQQQKEEQQRRRFFNPDGLKIRIFDAWELQHRGIEHNVFDEYFEKIGAEVIKQTQPERCRENRDVFNTNRFVVVKKTNNDGTEIDFGNRITVAGTSFKLSYFGIKKFCGLCNISHGWDCPTKVRHDFMRQLRKGKTEKTKLYADSTLRHTNQLALTTDTACMSGGGIGQLCNAIPYDEPHAEVIIKAGTNELKEENLKQFVHIVQQAEAKLLNLAANTAVTVVLPPIPADIPEQIVKGKFLTESITKIGCIDVITLQDVETDETNHPTQSGTSAIIDQIDAKKEIVLPKCRADTTLPLKYRGVQTLFKVGCRGCNSLDFTRSLCDQCIETSKDIDTNELEEQIRVLKEEMFPAIPTIPTIPTTSNDIEMKVQQENHKRLLSNDEDVDLQNAKSARSSAN